MLPVQLILNQPVSRESTLCNILKRWFRSSFIFSLLCKLVFLFCLCVAVREPCWALFLLLPLWHSCADLNLGLPLFLSLLFTLTIMLSLTAATLRAGYMHMGAPRQPAVQHWTLLWILIWKDSSVKNVNYIIIYSPSCYPRSMWLLFLRNLWASLDDAS